jgi:hypothetical protein
MAEDTDQPEDNEAIRAAKRAKRAKASAEAREARPIGWKTAAGIGIGSAAVVAALIYANKARKKDDD